MSCWERRLKRIFLPESRRCSRNFSQKNEALPSRAVLAPPLKCFYQRSFHPWLQTSALGCVSQALDDLSFSWIRMNHCAQLAHFHLVLYGHYQLADALSRTSANQRRAQQPAIFFAHMD